MFLQQLLGFASDWQDKIVNAVENILVPVLVIGCSIGTIWAVIVGIKMMKADDKSARDENKAKLVNIAIAIVSTAVLIWLFYALTAWVRKDGNVTGLDDMFGPTSHIGSGLSNTLSIVKQCASMIFFRC